jgi:hypothetical protein
MAAWLTLVVSTTERAEFEQLFEEVRSAGRVLAESPLLDAGSGPANLVALEREAWKEVRRRAAGKPDVRVLRVWDEVFGDGEGAGGPLYLSLVANVDEAALEYDDPTVTGAARATLATFLPLLATRFVAISTLMMDWSHCSGALTVFEAASQLEATTLAASDPWRAIGPARLYRVERAVFRRVAPPVGPSTQRYGAANPWPSGTFTA